MPTIDPTRLAHWMAVLAIGYSPTELSTKCRVTPNTIRNWRRGVGNRRTLKAATEGSFKDLSVHRIRALEKLGEGGSAYHMRTAIIMRWAVDRLAPGTYRKTVSTAEAVRWLSSMMHEYDGEVLIADITEEADANKISKPTLYRAKEKCGIVSDGVHWRSK